MLHLPTEPIAYAAAVITLVVVVCTILLVQRVWPRKPKTEILPVVIAIEGVDRVQAELQRVQDWLSENPPSWNWPPRG